LYVEKFRRGTSTIASAVTLFQPTTVANLLHRASIFVYSTIGVAWLVARVDLQHVMLVAVLTVKALATLSSNPPKIVVILEVP